MSTPYSSSPRAKVRNSALPAPSAVEDAVSLWVLMDSTSDQCSGRRRHRDGAAQACGVDDQRHPAVAEDGRAGYAGDAAVVVFQVLDHDLLLAEQVVHFQRQPAPVGL